jgi:hypothetical protein
MTMKEEKEIFLVMRQHYFLCNLCHCSMTIFATRVQLTQQQQQGYDVLADLS